MDSLAVYAIIANREGGGAVMPLVAYRAKRSRRRFNQSQKAKAGIAAAVNAEVKPHFIDEFNKRVANWKHRPTFQARQENTADATKLYVYPTGPNKAIFEYVDKGTRAHIIVPRRAKALIFRTGYQPKTKPPDIYGGPGVATGKRVAARLVHHPGNAPRKHTKGIKEKNKAWYSRTMENIWRRVIRTL